MYFGKVKNQLGIEPRLSKYQSDTLTTISQLDLLCRGAGDKLHCLSAQHNY